MAELSKEEREHFLRRLTQTPESNHDWKDCADYLRSHMNNVEADRNRLREENERLKKENQERKERGVEYLTRLGAMRTVIGATEAEIAELKGRLKEAKEDIQHLNVCAVCATDGLSQCEVGRAIVNRWLDANG